MMGNGISGYLWAWKNTESGKKSLKTLKKFHPESNLYINVDRDGSVDEYTKIGNELNAIVTVNDFQLGYCGDFGDVVVGRECWSKESTFEFIRGIYNACKTDTNRYMMVLEEDDFILKPITIIDTDFSMAIHPTSPSPTGRYRPNPIPFPYVKFIIDNDGNPGDNIGYGSGGGVIFDRNRFITAWDSTKDLIWDNYDMLKSESKIIGWADYILQFIMQLDGCDIVQNDKLCEHWEVPDFSSFEIITGLKDIDIIRSL